jgi:hypothetical protein
VSLYNLVNGVRPAAFTILPMLGKHAEEYPRFRDCFTKDEARPELDNHIHVHTRVGGNNRDDYEDEIAAMRSHPEFVTDFDDDFDCTFATYVFRVPAKWQADFNLIIDGKLRDVSKAYKAELYRIYPKLKEKWDEVFGTQEAK